MEERGAGVFRIDPLSDLKWFNRSLKGRVW